MKMKHLKLFETKYDQNYLIKFDQEKYELYKLIEEFVTIEKIWNFDENSSIINIYIEHDIEKVGDTALVVIIMDANLDNDTFYLNENQLENLYSFMKDPELHRSAHKYNL